MRKLNKFFERFFYGLCEEKRVKFCLKILKTLNKDCLLLPWFLYKGDYNEYDYCARFRSSNGTNFLITLYLAGDQSADCMRYEFGINLGEYFDKRSVKLGYVIFKTDEDHPLHPKPAQTWVTVQGTELPLKHGYLILELYNKVANQIAKF